MWKCSVYISDLLLLLQTSLGSISQPNKLNITCAWNWSQAQAIITTTSSNVLIQW
ncbi:hypothetical protein KC19_2G184100 [Ceratodon purpureus]|uniref:Uncharacterized protein n=1 Tax=Ceratodon purpureus TaxID=3225 RepID=A0A8T0IX63_CERPU|nr:hypothetical protein KC19_2G184100 [Ceratodon purpureus]